MVSLCHVLIVIKLQNYLRQQLRDTVNVIQAAMARRIFPVEDN